MDRLTIPNWDYNDMSLGTIGPCLARLSAYEDIGLEPEQVRDMMTDRVVQCRDCKKWGTMYCTVTMGEGKTTQHFYCADGKRKEGSDNG